jgi:hypothetical protein
MSDTIYDRLRRGEMVVVGNKLMAVCQTCSCLIQVNKWLFGSLHVCAPTREDQK